ncbi:MAG: hypothetical protein HGB18_05105 [Candidatus Moranbacteria bacterium]|nr:hypothetical protein [Candidatus Moranbacteria bacterium]
MIRRIEIFPSRKIDIALNQQLPASDRGIDFHVAAACRLENKVLRRIG